MMHLDRIISELRAERRLINDAIYVLERLERLQAGADIEFPTTSIKLVISKTPRQVMSTWGERTKAKYPVRTQMFAER
jgi:hypothetical protein